MVTGDEKDRNRLVRSLNDVRERVLRRTKVQAGKGILEWTSHLYPMELSCHVPVKKKIIPERPEFPKPWTRKGPNSKENWLNLIKFIQKLHYLGEPVTLHYMPSLLYKHIACRDPVVERVLSWVTLIYILFISSIRRVRERVYYKERVYGFLRKVFRWLNLN